MLIYSLFNWIPQKLIQKGVTKVKGTLFFGFLIRFMLETYLEFTICAWI